MDTAKYDRQIRLFGAETQSRLMELKVQILGLANFASSEILKNLVLLGVGKIIVQKDILDHTRKLVPDDLTEINESLAIELSDEEKDPEFLFIVDVPAEDSNIHGARMCVVCSRCLTIRMGSSGHECDAADADSSCTVARQCLVGGIAVQEFVKLVQGKRHADCYRAEL